LKGGTLLSNVYRSPRQSIKDADYTYLDPQTLRAPELERALTIDGEYGFHLAPQEVFSFDRDMFDGDPPFSMDGITLGLRGRDRELKITVSVRAGERLDPPAEKLFYYDPLLARDQRFEVNGLTRDELAAEKTLAWCSKPLSKHFVDLAYLAREHHEQIDREKVANLVRRKFKAEGRSRRYPALGIRRPGDLGEDWERIIGAELLFLPSESDKPPEQTLTDPSNVERICLDFWQPTLDLLARM
jgi:Nucleotidyl transferase AbiEii toxin, Type IV TA system